MSEPWRKVVTEPQRKTKDGDCEHCGEVFKECECIRIGMQNMEYKHMNGALWGRVK